MRNRAVPSAICELGLLSEACVKLNVEDLDLVAYRLTECRLSAGLAEKLERYLRLGRPALLTNPEETALFLGRGGQRIIRMATGMAMRVCAGAGNVAPRLLHRSWQAHHQAQAARRGLR